MFFSGYQVGTDASWLLGVAVEWPRFGWQNLGFTNTRPERMKGAVRSQHPLTADLPLAPKEPMLRNRHHWAQIRPVMTSQPISQTAHQFPLLLSFLLSGRTNHPKSGMPCAAVSDSAKYERLTLPDVIGGLTHEKPLLGNFSCWRRGSTLVTSAPRNLVIRLVGGTDFAPNERGRPAEQQTSRVLKPLIG